MTTYPKSSDPVSAFTRADGTSEAHSIDHGRVIGIQENVKHYGATGDGVTDDATAIQAALTAAASSGGVVFVPNGTYIVGTTLTMGDGVSLVGASRAGAILSSASGLTGCLIRTSGRDDDNPNTYQRIHISNIQLRPPASSAAAFYLLDITGARHGVFERLRLEGRGVGVANQTAVRVSDRNPANTSHKSTFFNRFSDIQAEGGWARGIYYEEIDGNSSHNTFNHWNSYSKIALEFGTFNGSSFSIFSNGYLFGDGTDVAVKGTVPADTVFTLWDQESHSSAGTLLANIYSNEPFALGSAHLQKVYLGAAGATAASPVGVGSGTPSNFVAGTYIKVASGVGINAGANTYTYTLNSVDATFVDSILVFPISGLPDKALSFQATLSGTTMTLTVTAADAVTLSANLVLRVLAFGKTSLFL